MSSPTSPKEKNKKPAATDITQRKIVSKNRRARHDYHIETTLEAGIVLQGSEVKSLRGGQGSIAEAYAHIEGSEAFLSNSFIPEYNQATLFSHSPRRPRKILLHAREIRKLTGLIRRRGKTLIPLSLYFNPRGKLKVELGVAEGKKKVDKRAAIKERDWKIEKARVLKKHSL